MPVLPEILCPAPAPARMLRVLVMDENPLSQDWICQILRAAVPGTQVTLTDGPAAALGQLTAGGGHDLALIEPDLREGGGIALIRRISASLPGVAPVVITSLDDDATLFQALAAGARGYILKDTGAGCIAGQFSRMAAGEPPLSPCIARRVLGYFHQHSPPLTAPSPPPAPYLTRRELQVLRLLGQGVTLPDMAGSLGISANTCATHTKTIYRKLNISSRAEAALAASRRGLI